MPIIKTWALVSAVLALFFISACSHNIKKMPLKATGATGIINSLSQQQSEAYALQADILAHEDFTKGNDLLNEVREEASEEEVEMEELREEASYSKAFFTRAIDTAKKKQKAVRPITDARKSALKAGVRQFPELAEKLNDTDDDVRSASDNFNRDLTASEYANLQQKYLNLEISSVQNTVLGKAKKMMTQAKDNDADDKAPRTLKRAQMDLKSADNVIASNPRNPKEYSRAVNQALTTTLFLSDVMNTIKEKGGDLKELVAVELVRKNRKLGQMDQRISSLKGHVTTAHARISGLGNTLNQTGSELQSAQEKVNFQQAMNKVRKEFSEEEAEVYQRGNELIIRLKKINFAVGKHELPEDSKPLLNKVNTIVSKVDPQSIVIEGHTDSTGDKSFNKTLSKERAQTVANFMKTKEMNASVSAKGYGASKPLAANTTKKGRRLNRRVDIVVKAKN